MEKRSGSAGGLLIFLLYGMFALFSLLLVVIGARVYRNVTETGKENTQIRASLSYVANKVRMSGEAVYVEERGGMPVLVLEQTVQGNVYETLIYYYEGAVRENFGAAGRPFSPENGETIGTAGAFSAEETKPGELLLKVTGTGGKEWSMHLAFLSGEEP